MIEKGQRVRVLVKIEDPDHPYRGCGAWGEGDSEDAARRIARTQLRSGFGPVKHTTTTVEWIRREVARLGPLSVTVEPEPGTGGSVYLEFWHDQSDEAVFSARLDENDGHHMVFFAERGHGGAWVNVFEEGDFDTTCGQEGCEACGC